MNLVESANKLPCGMCESDAEYFVHVVFGRTHPLFVNEKDTMDLPTETTYVSAYMCSTHKGKPSDYRPTVFGMAPKWKIVKHSTKRVSKR